MMDPLFKNHRRGGGVDIYLDNCLLSNAQLVKSSSGLGFDIVIVMNSVKGGQ